MRKATISFVLPVHLSAWNYSTTSGLIFIKLYIWLFFQTPSGKLEFLLKYDKDKGYSTQRDMFVFINFS